MGTIDNLREPFSSGSFLLSSFPSFICTQLLPSLLSPVPPSPRIPQNELGRPRGSHIFFFLVPQTPAKRTSGTQRGNCFCFFAQPLTLFLLGSRTRLTFREILTSVIKVESCQAEHGWRPGLSCELPYAQSNGPGCYWRRPRLILEAPGREAHCKVAEW